MLGCILPDLLPACKSTIRRAHKLTLRHHLASHIRPSCSGFRTSFARCGETFMTGHVRPAIEQPMLGNVRVVLRRAQIAAFTESFPSLATSGHYRAICWARNSAAPRAPALHRGSLTARPGTAALPPLPEAALQHLQEVESRILRYASSIAVYLRHDGSLSCLTRTILSTKASELRKQCCPCLHRSFSAEAALDIKDAAVVEEPSRALAAREQERSVTKSKKGGTWAPKRESASEGRIVDDSVHCIRHQDIPRGVWTALLKLRGAGGTSSACPPTLHTPKVPEKTLSMPS